MQGVKEFLLFLQIQFPKFIQNYRNIEHRSKGYHCKIITIHYVIAFECVKHKMQIVQFIAWHKQ